MMKTPDTINGKTPEEIKKGLKCCTVPDCSDCPYNSEPTCTVKNEDALAYIQQLETDLENEKNKNEILIFDNDKLMEEIDQVERERDAALQALHDICSFCKGHCLEISGGYLPDCEHCMIKNYRPENTKEADSGGETTSASDA